MTYLVFGADAGQKESRIAELKNKHLSNKGSINFDYEVLSGHKLEPEALRKALLALPVFSHERFVLLRECHKLTEHNRNLLVDFLAKSRTEHLVLVLESDEFKASDSFLSALRPFVQIVQTQTPPKPVSVFDVTKAMSLKQQPQALKILYVLLTEGQHPLQILGGLVWFWGELRDALPKDKFENGLRVLQEADLNIKRSRLNPDYALEILIVKLCAFMD